MMWSPKKKGLLADFSVKIRKSQKKGFTKFRWASFELMGPPEAHGPPKLHGPRGHCTPLPPLSVSLVCIWALDDLWTFFWSAQDFGDKNSSSFGEDLFFSVFTRFRGLEMATAQSTRPCAVVSAPRRAAWQLISALRNSVSAAPHTVIFYIFLQLLLVNYFFMYNNG